MVHVIVLHGMLFGPEWSTAEPPNPVPRPKKARKVPVVRDWIAAACECENCGRPRIAGREYIAACEIPGCSKLLTRGLVAKNIERARAAVMESEPDQPKLVQCVRMAWRYMRGRMRRGS